VSESSESFNALQAARHYDIKPEIFNQQVCDGKIPFHRWGGDIVFLESELDEVLSSPLPSGAEQEGYMSLEWFDSESFIREHPANSGMQLGTAYFSPPGYPVPSSGEALTVDVTPEMAEAFLGRNTCNRALRPRVVARYAQLMKAGSWQKNGEAIQFRADGSLANGQHRLHAIIKAGVAVPLLIVTGLSSEAAEYVDFSVPRSNGDRLNMRGLKRTHCLSAALTLLGAYEKAGGTFKGVKLGALSLDPRELYSLLVRYPGIIESDKVTNRRALYSLVLPRVATVLHCLFSQESEEQAAAFFGGLSGDISLGDKDPVFQLRNCLIKKTWKSKEGATAKLQFQVLALIKAWNYMRLEREISVFKVGKSEEAQDIL
jgi:hypothetical protein